MHRAGDRNIEDIVRHRDLAVEFFYKGLAEIDESPAQASEKLYKSVEEGVKALAIYYDLRDVLERVGDRGRWSVRDLEDAVVRLSKILGEWFRRAWEAAYYLHVEGFHEGRLSPASVRERVGDVERVIEEIKKITI
ncbi:MAG: PaREP1 family protein [Fervidicoccaceae archaeon]